jgi:hypothetical protein
LVFCIIPFEFFALFSEPLHFLILFLISRLFYSLYFCGLFLCIRPSLFHIPIYPSVIVFLSFPILFCRFGRGSTRAGLTSAAAYRAVKETDLPFCLSAFLSLAELRRVAIAPRIITGSFPRD